eukprot:95465-Rhodomonas_salina.1
MFAPHLHMHTPGRMGQGRHPNSLHLGHGLSARGRARGKPTLSAKSSALSRSLYAGAAGCL